LDVIEDLDEHFNERIYLTTQEQQSQHGTKNKDDEVFEVGQVSHDLLHNVLLGNETLIITKINIIDSKTDKQCIEGMWWNRNKHEMH
jgi:hypothetical protein